MNIARKQVVLPYTFEYDGQTYRGFEGVLGGALKVSVEKREFPDYPGAGWYTVWFENVGDGPTATLKNIRQIDLVFAGERPLLRGILGDHGQKYRPYEHDFTEGGKEFVSLEGRATHNVFPYFDLVHGGGGTLIALGWAGTWKANFSPVADGVRLVAENCVGFEAQLLPGEKMRTALVVRIPYAGRNADKAANLWRKWYLKYILPRNADGSALKPLSTAGFAPDTGLPNSDGSISERHFTWRPTLEKLIAEKIVPDFRWFDAGWYSDPSGKTVESDWWGTIGSWELDKEKWPGATFRESNEACHKAGMKVFVWFEPERVTNVPDLVRNYGYREEWSAATVGWGTTRVFTSDLGNPECLAWTLGRIVKMMDENAVDMYREDNNSDPGGAWKLLDERTAGATGLVRKGVSENKGIQGHYALWDGIIEYCRSKGKCPYVDSCASGGGRNDIESMRRGFPMMRSDADRTTSSLRLSMTSTFCRWIPFHGSATKETKGELESAKNAASKYVNRASLLPVYSFHEPVTRNKELDFDALRRNIAEWRSVSRILLKDFYVLTPWHSEDDTGGWTAFAYDDPESRETILLAFRQEKAEDAECTLKLPFAAAGKTYEFTDDDTGETFAVSGETLVSAGITVKLPEPKSSKLYRIRNSDAGK